MKSKQTSTYYGLGKTLGDNLDWKFEHERQMEEREQEEAKRMVQDDIKIQQKINEINHDYQRMRKLAKKRRIGILNKANKMRAHQEKELRKKLGGESWVEVQGTWKEKVVWVLIGLIVGMWLH